MKYTEMTTPPPPKTGGETWAGAMCMPQTQVKRRFDF
jgi:hypothetical protein